MNEPYIPYREELDRAQNGYQIQEWFTKAVRILHVNAITKAYGGDVAAAETGYALGMRAGVADLSTNPDIETGVKP